MSLKRKIFLIIGSVLALVTVAITVLYFWITTHAESLLTKLVNEQSHGRLQLSVKKIDFNLFKLRVIITQPELKTKDSINIQSGYHVSAKNITFKYHALFSYVLHKQFNVDSIIINSPEIDVFKYKAGPQKTISLTEEVNKVYQSLESALKVVQLNYFHIDSAKFNIYDRTKPGSNPLQISNLNLTINRVSTTVKDSTDNRFLFADRILLEIFNQDIQLKDGLQGIKFKRLRLSTGSKTIKLDSCNLYGRKTDSSYNALNISFDSINISNLDFNMLVKNNILKLDSALCINPHIDLRLAINEKKGKSGLIKNVPTNKDSVALIFKKLLGDIDIGYLAVKDATINLESKKDNRISTRTADNIDFGIKNLVIINDTAIPIQLGELELAIRNYTAYKLDSLSAVKFDSIKLIKNKIILANFSFTTTKDNPQLINSTIKTKAFEVTDIKWPELIYEQRLIAGTASLVNPEVNLILPDKKAKKPTPVKSNAFLTLNTIKDKIQLKNFFIVDGVVNIKMANGVSLNAEHFFAGIKVNQLLKEHSLKNYIDAVDNLSFGKVSFVNSDLQLLAKGGSYSNVNKTLKLKEVKQTKADQSVGASLTNVELNGININEGNDFSVSNLLWGNANISINKRQRSDEKSATAKKADYKITVNHTTGGPTHFIFNTDKIEASTQINQLSANEISLEAGKKPTINGLKVDGQPFLINQNKTESNVASFNISDNNASTLHNVTLRLPIKDKTLKLFLPELAFSTDINKDINGLIAADFIELNKPVISFESTTGAIETAAEHSKGKLPLMQIGTLKINEPTIENLPDNLAKKMQITAGIAEFTIRGINSDREAIRIDSVLATFKTPNFKNDKIKLVSTGNEFIRLVASDFTISPWADSSSEKWSFTLNAIHSSNFLIHTFRSDSLKQVISLKSLNLERLALNSGSVKNYKELLKNSDRFLITNGDVVIDNGKTIIAVNNLQLDKSKNKLSLDSFSFSPVMDRESFMKTKTFQSTYIQFKTGNILVNDVNFNRLIDDTVFAANKITLIKGYLSLYKDKRLPFQYGIEKPMLTQLIGQIKLKINVDSLLIRATRIDYEEVNDKTLLLGKVKLDDIRGNVTGIKNFNFSSKDSLRFTVSSKIMDAAKTKVKYAQSYTDSLLSFHLVVNVSPFDMTKLNPLLEPLVSARVNSGFLDTVSLSAIGRKYVAWGKMKMYYHNLDFQYLDKGSTEKKTFKTKLITFFGNLIVHKNNETGTGDIYAERLPEKGFPNYWIRILLNGALTNTGIRSNKKAEKKYHEGVKKFDVPPITEITLD